MDISISKRNLQVVFNSVTTEPLLFQILKPKSGDILLNNPF